MARKFSYADAVKLLGAKEARVLVALDKIVGGALLGGVAFGVKELLGWFDAKVDVVRLGHTLLVKAAERRSGLSRHSRTERLQAAHAVIVVVAFFETVYELDLPLSTGSLLPGNRRESLELLGLTDLFDGSWPMPSAELTYEANQARMHVEFRRAATSVGKLLRDSAMWDRLDETGRDRLLAKVADIPMRAVERYSELMRQLAGDYPELLFWFQVQDAIVARASLVRLETAMNTMLVGRDPDERRRDLARKYRAVLDRPIIDPGDVPYGLRIPITAEAYVDPDFQVVAMEPEARPSVLEWWDDVRVRSDLHQYLVGYLTSPTAVSSPLLVLGDPGSGKSMLTKVLAARLPAGDFLAVRVELRGAPAEADLLEQIEYGVRAALQEEVGWAELARSARDALPVVMLDGFDELLQATGVSQTRYLEKVRQFQRDRAEAGYPVAVVVTSRISVCGGVRIPVGAHVLRLVPFAEEHIVRWLDVWNVANDRYFQVRKVPRLAPEVVLAYRDLAEQPLLLLMLALYDAVDSALRRSADEMAKAQLYERLLARFTRREVAKGSTDRTDADLAADAEGELEQLSVVAFAMFNRGNQWVSEADLSADLAALLDVERQRRQQGMSTPLSAGEAVLGRFFFVQRAQAVRDSQTLRTYEFLHATFGEFLVARFTWRVLYDLHQVEVARPRRLAGAQLDDSDLYALLSFAPLTSRKTVIDFLAEIAVDSPDRLALAETVKRLFEEHTEDHVRTRADYLPVKHPTPTRYAIYGLNLVLLYGAVRGAFDIRELGIEDWPRLTAFWKSQLPDGEWSTLITSTGITWSPNGSAILTPGRPGGMALAADLPKLRFDPTEMHFTGDPVGNVYRRAVEGRALFAEDLMYVRAVMDLDQPDGSDYGRWADEYPDLVVLRLRGDHGVTPVVLAWLATTRVANHPDFWTQMCDRIGRVGFGAGLLEIVGNRWARSVEHIPLEPMLDAWLRLHEGGYVFPAERTYPDLAELLARLGPKAFDGVRPDIARRLGHAMRELEDEQAGGHR